MRGTSPKCWEKVEKAVGTCHNQMGNDVLAKTKIGEINTAQSILGVM
jgi:hypothetical protein